MIETLFILERKTSKGEDTIFVYTLMQYTVKGFNETLKQYYKVEIYTDRDDDIINITVFNNLKDRNKAIRLKRTSKHYNVIKNLLLKEIKLPY